MVLVRLLGRPTVLADGVEVPGPRGHKAWGLLAYLVGAGAPVPRDRLVSLLFPDAEDGLAALRWSLAQLRRSIGQPQSFAGDPVSLALGPGVQVDVQLLAAAPWFVDDQPYLRFATRGHLVREMQRWGVPAQRAEETVERTLTALRVSLPVAAEALAPYVEDVHAIDTGTRPVWKLRLPAALFGPARPAGCLPAGAAGAARRRPRTRSAESGASR